MEPDFGTSVLVTMGNNPIMKSEMTATTKQRGEFRNESDANFSASLHVSFY